MRQIRYSTVHARLFMADHLTTSLAFAPNSFFRLLEFRISLDASLTTRALFLVRIVLTVALNRAVRSIIYISARTFKKFDLVTSSNLLGSHRYNFTTALHKVHFILVPFQSISVEQMGFSFRLSISLWLMLAMCFADSEVDERCFDKSCGKEFDPKGPLVHCNFL